MSTLKQRERAVARGVRAFEQAAASIAELNSIAIEHGVAEDKMYQEERVRSHLLELARWWDESTWWRKGA